MAIGLFIGLVCSVIGLFFGYIILFDSISLGIAAGVCCNQFPAIHPALCPVIGIVTFLLLLWLQNTSIGFWLVGGLLTLIYAAVFGLLAYFISEHDSIWDWVIGLNEMFKIVEREDDIIANEEKVFDDVLRTINAEILGADLIDAGLILSDYFGTKPPFENIEKKKVSFQALLLLNRSENDLAKQKKL